MANPLDPSVFPGSADFYIAEFESILVGITSCYKMMIEDNVSVPSNNENRIRDILYSKYLNDNAVRKKIGFYYNIICEPAEYINYVSSGFVDLRFFSKNSLMDTSAYYIIECKRLDNQNLNGTTGLNAKYIKNGIMRFVDGKYSTNQYLNGMIGFVVEQMDITANITNINKLLRKNFSNANTETILTFHNFIKDFKYQYYSIHKDIKNRKFKLYHLMFDFSANIEKS